MKAVILASLLALAACGVKGPPQKPGTAAPAKRTVIGATETPEAPAARPAAERRFILDGLL